MYLHLFLSALIPRNDCVEDLLLKCKIISPLTGGND